MEIQEIILKLKIFVIEIFLHIKQEIILKLKIFVIEIFLHIKKK